MKWSFSVCVHRSFFSRGVVLNYDSSCFHEVRCHVNGSWLVWLKYIIFNMHLCAMQMYFQVLTILNNARVHCATYQNKLVRSDGYLLVSASARLDILRWFLKSVCTICCSSVAWIRLPGSWRPVYLACSVQACSTEFTHESFSFSSIQVSPSHIRERQSNRVKQRI